MIVHQTVLGVAKMFYIVVFFLHVLYFVSKKRTPIKGIWFVFYCAFAVHTAGIALRWAESYWLGIGHAPLSNFYESLVFFSWSISFLLITMRKKLSHAAITFAATAASLLLLAYASVSPSVQKGIQPLIPALQSNWLHIHVITCFLAYAAFFISFLCGVLYFFRSKKGVPTEKTLEEINYRSIIIGFSMLTSGILTGAVWAQYAWGSYWSWDPKEAWSLVTWIVYALFLHVRFVRGWRGKRIAIISIIGFACVIMTYFGVNFLLSGLHSYAT